MRIAAVLLDLDGVLVDSSEAWRAAMNVVRRSFDLPDIPPGVFTASFGQSIEADVATYFDDRLSPDALFARLEAVFPDVLTRITRIDPGGEAVIAALEASGRRLAVTTNSSPRTAAAMLAVTGYERLLPVVLTAADAPRPKPFPDLLLAACERRGRGARRGHPAGRVPAAGERADLLARPAPRGARGPRGSRGLRPGWTRDGSPAGYSSPIRDMSSSSNPSACAIS